tara:strand:+ start:338 stop:571 length:234 start_codon:yes stop_codon:yes gene_type:complete
MDINYIDENILGLILNNITFDSRIIYVPYGDGEQTLTFFHKDLYPFNSVNKEWYKIIKNIQQKPYKKKSSYYKNSRL